LIGVTFALLDFAEKFPMPLEHTIIVETGGMKGRREEITREELHAFLQQAFHSKKVFSEYGMTELLSQAYSPGDGKFRTPPWMKVFIRDVNDPLRLIGENSTGAINIIDFANLDSCCFIATSDLGRVNEDGSFAVMGRMDYSDVRGCNLMWEG
jgi:acyl-CoA synthetase (AMP-forming)/AMP-acid ligase II